MPGTTIKYKLPYPIASDPVNQGAAQIQALANRIEVILNAAGIAAPLALLAEDDDAVI